MAPTKESVSEEIPAASSLGDALLYATMCIVGLPVEVQVKDGSLYSGVLHTACFDRDHGIVLKKATKIGKGKCRANLALGDCVDTLIVLSSDLVQVVVRGFVLPADEGVVDHVVGKSTESVNQVESHSCSREIEREENRSIFQNSASRQVTESRADGDKEDNSIVEVANGAPSLSPSSNIKGRNSHLASLPDQLSSQEIEAPKALTSSDTSTSVCSTSSTSIFDITANSYATGLVTSNTTIPKKIKGESIIAKESKLNPDAKVFTPTATNYRQVAAPVPRFVSPSQMSNSLSVVPTIGAQLGHEVESFASRFTVPSKVVPYNNLIAAQAGNGTHYARPIVGHSSIRQLPVRVNGQYHPLQAGHHVYLNPHSQMVPAGPLNQPVYVHPVSQPIQGTPFMPQGHPRPHPPQANILKFQGTAAQPIQLPMAPPIMAGENQTLVAPMHVPFAQPYAVPQPVMISDVNGYIFR
ncbi:uncharacterized protein LOC122003086 isoform X2 [Zingiber officinale]|uniref:uncharacterized protein LOC122003086 isoform X2 n=1 Tax=Zingiber officinale TaxID=94328 RepID=UPI001C4D05C2|nr:uncharacterized protein LOC122003086 isoform X2 [Zingiber officinale]